MEVVGESGTRADEIEKISWGSHECPTEKPRLDL